MTSLLGYLATCAAAAVTPVGCELVLGCQHNTRVPVDVERPTLIGDLPDYVPVRADGWPAAQPCPECKRKRRVISIAWQVQWA